MGGGNKKRFNKSKTRILKQRGHGGSSPARALFVNGGVLSDWAAVDSPLSSRGRNSDSNHSKNGNNSKSVSRSGNSRGENQMRGGNAFGYVYPAVETPEASLPEGGTSRDENLEESHPIVLVDSKDTQILAYLDQTPVMGQNVEYTYDYSAGFSLNNSEHRGLGFSNEAEATTNRGEPSSKMAVNKGSSFVSSSSDKEMGADVDYAPQNSTEMSNDNDFLKLKLSPDENPGFLCIGGMRIYTQDMSDEDDGEELGEDQGEELLDEESSESFVSEDSNGSDTDESFDSDSDIDEEVAADYYAGIGGSDSAIDVDTLLGQILNVSGDDSCSGDIIDDTLEKLGGIALQEASSEYGMKKPRSRKSSVENCKSTPAILSSALGNLMLVKDPRNIYGRNKNVAKFSRSWPYEAQKSKRFGKFAGEKKKIRKEGIALKRRERMIRRGVDLEKLNLKLEKMVLDGLDMLSFEPMHSRDCSQVQRLAAIYRLRSGCQGSGKKRFVTVMRTQHTCMPSSIDKDRLHKLIGAFDGDDDFTVTNLKSANGHRSTSKMASKGSGSGPQDFLSLQRKSSKDKSNKSGRREASKKKRSDKPGSYAAQPMSFVSSGIMQSETVETGTNDKKERDETGNESKDASSSSKFGAFEQHTTGFGSKMMAKMGFLEGGGLGRAGQGMAEPIEVIQRPKSLGLGAKAPNTRSTLLGMGAKEPETSTKLTEKGSHQFGAFEKHTKGFGSKMMAKMGFIEGRGLGRDSQGIVNPLPAVRLPKSRGLGANN